MISGIDILSARLYNNVVQPKKCFVMKKVISSSNLRSNLFDVLETVETDQDYLLVTKKGKPVSAIVNLDYFEDLLALKSPEYLESVKEARESYKKGEKYTFDEVFGEL